MDGLLDCPHYTRPEVYEGMPVPAVLMSGNHAEIERWRMKQSLGPDLEPAAGTAREAEAERRSSSAAGRIQTRGAASRNLRT